MQYSWRNLRKNIIWNFVCVKWRMKWYSSLFCIYKKRNLKPREWKEALENCCARDGSLINFVDPDMHDAIKAATLGN